MFQHRRESLLHWREPQIRKALWNNSNTFKVELCPSKHLNLLCILRGQRKVFLSVRMSTETLIRQYWFVLYPKIILMQHWIFLVMSSILADYMVFITSISWGFHSSDCPDIGPFPTSEAKLNVPLKSTIFPTHLSHWPELGFFHYPLLWVFSPPSLLPDNIIKPVSGPVDFSPEDGDSMLFWNPSICLHYCMMSQPRILQSKNTVSSL